MAREMNARLASSDAPIDCVSMSHSYAMDVMTAGTSATRTNAVGSDFVLPNALLMSLLNFGDNFSVLQT